MKTRWIRWSVLISFETCVTLAALLGALFCFLDLVEAPVDRLAVSFYACLWALVCLLVFWLGRRFLPLCILGLLCIYGIAVYVCLQDVVRGAVSLGCQLSEVYAKTLPGAVRYYPLEQLEVQQAIRCSNLFLILAVAPAALAVAWAVARRRSFVWLFLFTCPTVLASVIILRTPPVLPLLALVFCWLVMALAGGGGKYGSLSAAKAGWLSAPAVAVLLLLAAAWAPMDGSYQRSARAESARLWLYSLGQGEAQGEAYTGPAPEAATGQTRLDTAGDLHFQGYTALRLYSEQPGKTYLRGFAAERYNGVSWRQAYETDYNAALEGAAFDPMNLLADTIRLNFPEQGTYQVILDQLHPQGAYLYAPYGLVTRPEQLEEAYRVRDSYVLLKNSGIQRYQLKVAEIPSLEQAPEFLAMPEQVEQGYRRFIEENCLQVPERLEPLLEQIAWQQNLPHVEDCPWYEVADQVADYLRQWARYDPAPGRLPQGQDYVEYFLTQSRAGYCMHFASASVLLLRSRGIPARYVEGYLVNDGDFGPDGWADVKDSRAHAWAEIYVDGVGWIPVESTPGYGGGPLEQMGVQQPEQPEQQTPEPPEQQPEQPEQPEQPPEPEEPAQAARRAGPLPRWISFAAAGGLLLLALLLRPVLARCWRRRRFEIGPPNRRALAVYRYAQKLKTYATQPDQVESIEQLGLKARFSAQGVTEQEAAQASLLAAALAQDVWRQSKWPRRFSLRWMRALL